MRHSKYNEERHRIIVSAVERGNYRSTAARMAGIDPSTLSNWLHEGLLDSENEVPYEESQYRRLFEEVDRKEAEYEARMLERVTTAADSGEPHTWQAAMTILERKHPDRFGRRQITTIEGGDKPIPIATAAILFDSNNRELANELLRTLSGRNAGRLGDAGSIEPSGPGLLQQPED